MGTVSELYPEGITELADMPHTLFTAIRMGLNFLSFEELPSEEQPPKKIWLDGEKLEEWFAAVKKNREDMYSGKGDKQIEDPVDNAAANGLIVGK